MDIMRITRLKTMTVLFQTGVLTGFYEDPFPKKHWETKPGRPNRGESFRGHRILFIIQAYKKFLPGLYPMFFCDKSYNEKRLIELAYGFCV